MEPPPQAGVLDEDGYTLLTFRQRDLEGKRQKAPEEGKKAAPTPWRRVAVTLGVLFGVILVVAVVLGVLVLQRRSSGSGAAGRHAWPPSHKPSTEAAGEGGVAPTRAAIPTGLPSQPCPRSWSRHGASCYRLVWSLDSWNGSRRRCSRLDSALLAIESPEEFDFVRSQTSLHPANAFWLGLSRRGAQGPWLWEDGSVLSPDIFPVRSTATQEGAPDSCAWIHGSDIYTQLCHTPAFSICKRLSV
ncbi:C-type lectin domain family 7 member A [Dipodomys spectabilis]|uniref:C-type lectin domain family 7 member A n=1 Tax=Dipodomys spectabilis TaxID=105255 RepID=UPI001C536CAA|nr:C-type lectin domain family 7 member A [Dipodomys spectabilis]